VNKPESDQSIDFDEQLELEALLSQSLTPILPKPDQKTHLRTGLLQKLSQSLRQESGLITTRNNGGQWKTIMLGIRFKPLWNGPAGNSVLIEFAPGATLPVHRHQWLEEGIVLRGGLQIGALDLGLLDYHLSALGSRHAKIQSHQGALAFLRGTSLGGDKSSVIREVIGGLWPSQGAPSLTIYAKDLEGWVNIAEGVARKCLYTQNNIASYYYRIAPGAEIPSHAHTQDEECLVLEGEVFMGDQLLQQWDYQVAPVGTLHASATTDVGTLLFIRGSGD
jgi:quercetin dioxygenase-like cupin family protein